jgi:hypothetical protein
MNEIVLKIYFSSSGKWSGSIVQFDEEIGGVAGCDSPEEVQDAVLETGLIFDRLEMV